jgi:hypothetical protein
VNATIRHLFFKIEISLSDARLKNPTQIEKPKKMYSMPLSSQFPNPPPQLVNHQSKNISSKRTNPKLRIKRKNR